MTHAGSRLGPFCGRATGVTQRSRCRARRGPLSLANQPIPWCCYTHLGTLGQTPSELESDAVRGHPQLPEHLHGGVNGHVQLDAVPLTPLFAVKVDFMAEAVGLDSPSLPVGLDRRCSSPPIFAVVHSCSGPADQAHDVLGWGFLRGPAEFVPALGHAISQVAQPGRLGRVLRQPLFPPGLCSLRLDETGGRRPRGRRSDPAELARQPRRVVGRPSDILFGKAQLVLRVAKITVRAAP